MDPAQSLSFKLINATEEEIVEFRFKSKPKDGQESGKPQVVRCLKSLLTTGSPSLQTMFSDRWNTNDPIEMDDDVDFDQANVFSHFVLIVSNALRVNQLSIHMSCNCYFYAEKYQIDGLKRNLLNHITYCSRPFKLDEITDCLALAELYQLTEFKTNLDGIKLDLEDKLVIGFYDICLKYQMEKLIDQLATFLCKKPLDKSWPFDLIAKIVDKERKDGEERIEKLESGHARSLDRLSEKLEKIEDQFANADAESREVKEYCNLFIERCDEWYCKCEGVHSIITSCDECMEGLPRESYQIYFEQDRLVENDRYDRYD